MRRRELLLAGAAAGCAAAQTAPLPPPRQAKITSSVMLWCLRGSLEEKIDIAARAGLQSVELVGEHVGLSDAQLDGVRKLARGYRLGIDTIGSMPRWKAQKLNLVDPAVRPALLAEVETNLRAARRLEVPMALLMSGDALPGRTYEEQFASMVEGAKRCGDLAARYGVTLIVEPLNTRVNHPGYFLNNCVDGLRLIREADHDHVRLLFDLYHEQVERGNVTASVLAALPYVKVFHVADNPGRHEPGTGEMNYEHLYRAIAKANYEGMITMEYLPTGEPVASLTKAVTEMRAAL